MEIQDNLQEADGKTEDTKNLNEQDISSKKEEKASKKEALYVEQTAESDKKNKNTDSESISSPDPSQTTSIEPDVILEDLDLNGLLNNFENLLKNEDIYAIRPKINRIKKVFNSKFTALLNKSKDAFLAEGGNSIDFSFSNPYKKTFNTLARTFRERNEAFEKRRAENFKKNLELRLQIVEDIKALININQNSKTAYNNFKHLQDQWRSIGKVPLKEANNVWNNYRHHVERFYDFLHLDRDLRDRDYKHNLKKKQQLIKSAQALANEQNLVRAFRELQALHKIWKEELGPVAKEHRETLWEQFGAATKLINDKRKILNDQIDAELMNNYNAKQAISQEITDIANSDYNGHSDWQKQIKIIEQLRQKFFQLGSVPKKYRNQSWADFKSSVRIFNKKKNNFYKFLKKDQTENLKKKKELVEVAEQNKDSEDFETTVILMKNIQNQWKSIGHIPRKDSSKLWTQFRTACNHFFNRYHDYKNTDTIEEIEALNQKQTLFTTLKSFEKSDNKEADLETLKDFSKQWSKLGRVSNKSRQIERDFYKLIKEKMLELGVSEEQVQALKYSNKLNEISHNTKALNNEILYVKKKIEEINSEVNQLENNLQFFSNVKQDNPMVIEVKNKIEIQKTQLSNWKQKLNLIKKMM